jgi:NADH dehydrogenase
LSTVKGLTKAGFRVTLMDRNLYSTFQPLLYQVATGGINPGDVTYVVGGFTRKYGARYCRGELATIDPGARRIGLADGREISYDYLIIATGVSASHYGIKGAEQYTYGLYTRHDAVTLRDRFMSDVAQLSMGPADAELAITMVGGGATGVELAGTMAELRNVVLRETFPDIDPARVHVRVVEMLPDLLTPFDPKLRGYTRDELVARGVDVRTDTAISEVTPDRVMLKDGTDLRSDITVWTAGVAAPPESKQWGLPQGKAGRILTGPDLRVNGQDRIFATGDIAWLEAGQETQPFVYHDKGMAATIGRHAAVIELAKGPDLKGTLAWLGWLVLHLFYLLGGRNRVSALVNLSWRYLAWGHGGTVIVGDEPPDAGPGRRPEPAASRPGQQAATQAGERHPAYDEA